MHIDSDGHLSAHAVSLSYSGRPVLSRVSLDIARGRGVAVVGPNGAGKTTLLRVLTGVKAPEAGWVEIEGRRLSTLTGRERARLLGVVPQRLEIGFGLKARDVVMLGRTPHLSFSGSPKRADRRVVEMAIEEVNAGAFAHRPYATLSGGEAQRVLLAMVLAQETPFLLLDEPTVHLDIGEQWRFMRLLHELRRRRQVAVLAILHDLTQAGLGFDEVMMIKDGRVVRRGRPAEVLTEAAIRSTFDAPVRVRRNAAGVQVVLDPQIPPDLVG